MQHKEIIDKLGGVRPLATGLNLKHHSQVQGWKERNSIPLKYVQRVLDFAKSRRIKLSAQDFLTT